MSDLSPEDKESLERLRAAARVPQEKGGWKLLNPDKWSSALPGERAKREQEVARAQAAIPLPADERGRVAGAVLGSAIGDALGHATASLTSFAAIRQRFGPAGVQDFGLRWEQSGVSFAPYTDDTQLAELVWRLMLLKCRMRAGLANTMTYLGQRFGQWAKNPQGGHRSPSEACMAAASRATRGWEHSGSRDAVDPSSVVRAYPMGIIFREEFAQAEEWAVAQSKITHKAPPALAASAATAVGVAACMKRADVPTVLNAMMAAAFRQDRATARAMHHAISEAGDRRREGEATLTRLASNTAVDVAAAACFVFARFGEDPREALLAAANTPGASDSIAALVGALMGARHGLGALPPEWVAGVERSGELMNHAQEAAPAVPEEDDVDGDDDSHVR